MYDIGFEPSLNPPQEPEDEPEYSPWNPMAIYDPDPED